jgi:uncharacterized protein (DUF2141 family)
MMLASIHCRIALILTIATTTAGCRSMQGRWPIATFAPQLPPKPTTPDQGNTLSSPRLEATQSSEIDSATLSVTTEVETGMTNAQAESSWRLPSTSPLHAFPSTSPIELPQPSQTTSPGITTSAGIGQAFTNQATFASKYDMQSPAEERLPVARLASGNPRVELPDAARLPEPPSVKLVVAGVRPHRGDVKVAIFTSAAAFPQPDAASVLFVLKAENTTLERQLDVSPPFAVAVYQDINGDGEVTRNRLGIPLEPFAFSNNAMGNRGPPTFEQAAITMTGSPTSLTIPITLP